MALARRYNAEGADELVVLDIAASRDRRPTFLETIRKVAAELAIPLTAGGGIRTLDDARAVVRAGADKITVNTAAVLRPELISELSEEFGSQAVVLAIDAKRDGERWRVMTTGGRVSTDLEAVSLGDERSGAWRWRNSSDLRGPRRNTKWVRRCAHRGDFEAGYGAGDCFRRGQMAATFCRDFLRRRGGCGFGSFHFS